MITIRFNGEDCELGDATSVLELLARFDLKSKQVAVEVNQEIAPRERHAEWMLQDGDSVEVVTLVGGG